MIRMFLLLGILLIGLSGLCADTENTESVNQIFNDNRAVVAVQKQPAYDNSQKQAVKNNWFCIVIQVNGKLDSISSSLQSGN